MILAAGRGERLRPLTDEIPKALVEVRGQSLLERHLENLRSAGISDVVINLGWHGEQIVTRVGSGSAYGLNVIYSDEGDHLLETGGGIYRALPMLGEKPFLVVNSDIYTDMPVPKVELQGDDFGHLVLVPTPEYRAHGDFDLDGDRVVSCEQPSLMFGGMAVYRPGFFDQCEGGRFSLGPMLFAAVADARLQGSIHAGHWTDIGTPEWLETLNRG